VTVHRLDEAAGDDQASPVPAIPRFAAPRRSNGMNSRSTSARLMPSPVSLTDNRTASGVRVTATMTWPPWRLYLTAFDSRLTSTWRSRASSADTDTPAGTDTPGTDAPGTDAPGPPASLRIVTDRAAAIGASMPRTLSTSGPTAMGRMSRFSSPASIRPMSRISSTRETRCSPAVRIWSTDSRESESAGSTSRSSSWPNPRIAFSGVLSSWLIRDRNALFCWLAAAST